MIARLYYRKFRAAEHVDRMFGTIETHVNNRIVAVTASLIFLRPHEHQATMLELWEYPDEDSMHWVRQSLQGATVIPDAMLPENTIHTLNCIYSHNADWE